MNKTNRRHLFERGNEIFAWLEGFKLEVPSDRRTTLEEQLQKLRNILALAQDYVVTDNAKRAIRFCGDEVSKAVECKKNNCIPDAMKCWRAARQLFEEAREDKESRARFIVGPDGAVHDKNL